MPVKHYTRVVNKRKGDAKQSHWSERQKFEAVTVYMMVGKWPLVAEATKVPIDTLKKWKQAPWWKEYEEEIRRSKHIETSGKLAKIRDKASEVVMDRLEHGDFQYDPKTGKFSRRPVSAKVAGDLLTKAIDKEILLEKLDDNQTINEQTVMERLSHIAEKLLQASGKKLTKPEVIDIEPISTTLESDYSQATSAGSADAGNPATSLDHPPSD